MPKQSTGAFRIECVDNSLNKSRAFGYCKVDESIGQAKGECVIRSYRVCSAERARPGRARDRATAERERATQTGDRALAAGTGSSSSSQQTSSGAAFPRKTKVQPQAARA